MACDKSIDSDKIKVLSQNVLQSSPDSEYEHQVYCPDFEICKNFTDVDDQDHEFHSQQQSEIKTSHVTDENMQDIKVESLVNDVAKIDKTSNDFHVVPNANCELEVTEQDDLSEDENNDTYYNCQLDIDQSVPLWEFEE